MCHDAYENRGGSSSPFAGDDGVNACPGDKPFHIASVPEAGNIRWSAFGIAAFSLLESSDLFFQLP